MLHTDLSTAAFNAPARPLESVARRRLYEEAVRRGEGHHRRRRARSSAGPASTPAARPTTSSSSASPRARRTIAWGAVNRPLDPTHFDALDRDSSRRSQGAELFVQDCFAGADPSTGCRSASSPSTPGTACSRATCSSSTRTRSTPTHAPRVHGHRRAELPGRPGAPRHRSDVVIALNFAERLVLIAGTSYAGEIKKSIFTYAELPAAAAGRPADALLGERRPRRRRGAVLRPVGHRQDDALDRSRAPADRRRRARLERPACSTSRAAATPRRSACRAEAEPQIYATTRRFGTVLENVVVDPRRRARSISTTIG